MSNLANQRAVWDARIVRRAAWDSVLEMIPAHGLNPVMFVVEVGTWYDSAHVIASQESYFPFNAKSSCGAMVQLCCVDHASHFHHKHDRNAHHGAEDSVSTPRSQAARRNNARVQLHVLNLLNWLMFTMPSS